MFIDAATAKALFAIIVVSTQGQNALTPQLPLHVEDRGSNWLVTGTPYTSAYANFCMSSIFFKKDTGEVVGIMSHGRMKTNEAQKAHWRTIMSTAEYDRVFGPPVRFEPNGIPDIYVALSGGLINTPAAASTYAATLLHMRSQANFRAEGLQATEVEGVWHVNSKMAGEAAGRELLTFSRKTGKVLSGNF